jgi:hypothetical protein
MQLMKHQNSAPADPEKLQRTLSGFEELIRPRTARGTITRVYSKIFLTPRSELGVTDTMDVTAYLAAFIAGCAG